MDIATSTITQNLSSEPLEQLVDQYMIEPLIEYVTNIIDNRDTNTTDNEREHLINSNVRILCTFIHAKLIPISSIKWDEYKEHIRSIHKIKMNEDGLIILRIPKQKTGPIKSTQAVHPLFSADELIKLREAAQQEGKENIR
jgi:hypothetical protein